MVLFGDDFTWQDTDYIFYNLDKLVKYFDYPESSLKLQYSTPSEYIDAIHRKKDIFTVSKSELYNEDMFPYGSVDSYPAIWTGYFTSRPTLKRTARKLSN